MSHAPNNTTAPSVEPSPEQQGQPRALARATGSRFEWEGDLADDCTCKVGNLLAHCENMGPIKWRGAYDGRTLSDAEIWFVSVGPVDANNYATGPDLFHSGEPGGLIVGGDMARAIAEAILSANPAGEPRPPANP